MLLYLYMIFIAVIGCVWKLVIKENDGDDDDDDVKGQRSRLVTAGEGITV